MDERKLGQAAAAGAIWSGIGRLGVSGLEFLTAIILARILGPDEFGLVAMVLVVIKLSDIFTDLGLGAALIQRESTDANAWLTALMLNFAAGCILAVLTVTFAPLIGQFFGRPEIVPVTRWVSLYFPLRALVLVAQASLSRSLQLRRLAYIEIPAALGGAVLAISAALMGLGVRAIAVQYVVFAGIMVVLLMPRTLALIEHGHWDRNRAQDLWSFSQGLLGFSIVNFAARNADDALIGRYVGASALGIYNRAYGLMLLPIGQVARVLDRVMFPALSRVRNDLERLRASYIRAVRVMILVTGPLFGVSAVMAEEIVLTLLGREWLGVAEIFRVLAIAGLATIVSTTSGWIFQATGQTRRLFWWGIVSSAIALAAFSLGVLWGAIGVAVAYAIRAFLLLPFSIEVPGKAVGLSFRQVAQSLMPELVVAAVATLTATLAKLVVLRASDDPLVLLSLTGAASIIVVVILTSVMRLASYQDIKLILRSAAEPGSSLPRPYP